MLAIEMASSIVDACNEDGQVVSLIIGFLLKGRDGLVVEFGRRCSSVGVIVIQDSMVPKRKLVVLEVPE